MPRCNSRAYRKAFTHATTMKGNGTAPTKIAAKGVTGYSGKITASSGYFGLKYTVTLAFGGYLQFLLGAFRFALLAALAGRGILIRVSAGQES
jgi:hypothetical protein